jgi:hypothetical protein
MYEADDLPEFSLFFFSAELLAVELLGVDKSSS